ncbi:cation diffusion facilitator family transporter [Halegenticoccus soli]|uniref:cation diffusion facilitator family transporter n=1 Tax=Halegenticoccus soli TaxID=1985678 RepID=UPI000C6D8949|nr:cation diffusion facilitator family transporter [Halegenticoccus soli]
MSGHDHDGHDHDGHDRGAAGGLRALALALGINTAFFFVELVGALLADSLTLLADATHMLTDSASLGLALFAAWAATRPPDPRRTYGYHRAEVIGALLNGVFLLAVVGYVLVDAYGRFRNPRPVDAGLVVLVGVLGLAANAAAAWVLSDHRGSLNVEGAFLHLLADAAGSVAAIVLGVVLSFTDLYVLDPLFALVVAALVLYSVADLLRDSLNILLQGTPGGIDVDEVRAALAAVEDVEGVHDLHVWALDSSRTALSAHLVAPSEADADAILARTQALLSRDFSIDHATVQIETGERALAEEFDCYAANRAA